MGDKNKRRAETEKEHTREKNTEENQVHNSDTAKRLNQEKDNMDRGHRFGSGK
jgi:hypothetical protein